MAIPVAVTTGVATTYLSTRDPAVRVTGGPATGGGRQICARLVSGLPDRLGQLPARPVAGARQSAAAWGNPPVVLRCGATVQPNPVGQLVVLDGVQWTPAVDPRGVTWTTVGRRVTVSVRVPRQYDSQGPLLARLSPVLIRTVPTS